MIRISTRSAAPASPRNQRRVLGMIVILALLAACQRPAPGDAAGRPAARAGGKGDPASRPVPVTLGRVVKAELPVSVTALGTITPLATVTVRSRVDGQVMRIAFTEGQTVRAGDVLAQIDPRPFDVQYEQAAGQLNRDAALLQSARIDLDRYRLLYSQDSIAKQLVDTQESQVRQYEGAVRTDEANVANARLQQGYARVTAPIGGRVGLRQVDVGNIVHAADATGIVVITQLRPITAVGTVPQDSVPAILKRLQSHEPVPVEAYSRDGTVRLATGTLLTLDNQIDVSTGTVKLKAQFANDDYALFPNQFVNLKVTYKSLKDATVVPSAAVQQGPDGHFVYVAEDDSTVRLQPVRTLATVGEQTAVDAPFAPGTRVVTDGVDRLRDGAKVKAADEHDRDSKEPSKKSHAADRSRGPAQQ
jgi:membrane fusion protein, multidrug efflux system